MKEYFDIAVKNISGMKFFEAFDNLNEDFPDLLLLKGLFFLLLEGYFMTKITVIGELHDNTWDR